jgi:hypothetical protein
LDPLKGKIGRVGITRPLHRAVVFMVSFLCFCRPVCYAQDTDRSVYLEIVNGFPPTLSESEKNDLQNKIHQETVVLRSDFEVLDGDHLKNCDLYLDILSKLTKQIDKNLGTLPAFNQLQVLTDAQVLQYTRLQLLIPGLFGLHALFKSESEGGFGTIDRRIHTSCPVAHRASVTDDFNHLVMDLSQFNRKALGNPGLFGFEQLTDRLFEIADRQETYRNNISLGAFGLATLASIAFWEFAPVAVGAAVGRISVSVPQILQPMLIFGTRSAALGGEGLAYHDLDQALLPPRSDEPKEILMSWQEQMEELQNLVNTPLASPQIYIAYLGQIKRQMAAVYQPWLRKYILQNQKKLSPLQAIGPRR